MGNGWTCSLCGGKPGGKRQVEADTCWIGTQTESPTSSTQEGGGRSVPWPWWRVWAPLIHFFQNRNIFCPLCFLRHFICFLFVLNKFL